MNDLIKGAAAISVRKSTRGICSFLRKYNFFAEQFEFLLTFVFLSAIIMKN